MSSKSDVVHVESPTIHGDGAAAYEQAMHAYRKGDVGRAIEKLELSIQLNPKRTAAHNNLGLLYYEQRKLVLAAQHFDIASQLSPSDARPLNNLGMTLEAGGRIMEAISFYEQASTLDPNHPLYLGNWVRARVRIGEDSELLGEQLSHLAFIESRPDWIAWVDEQLAIHRNPMLDRGPNPSMNPLGRSQRNQRGSDTGANGKEHIYEPEKSSSLRMAPSVEFDFEETLPVPVPIKP